MKIIVKSEDALKRLDNFLANEIGETRSNISKHIKLKDVYKLKEKESDITSNIF